MSYLAFERFLIIPDFTQPASVGVEDDRQTIDLGGGSPYMRWSGRTDHVFRFRFQTFTQEEWQRIRAFFDRHGGRSKAFYLPSWRSELVLAEDAQPGDLTIKIKGNHYSGGGPAERPDALGRHIFIANHVDQTSTHWIKSATADGEDEILLLEEPIVNAAKAGRRSVVGLLYLARLLNDSIDAKHSTPEHVQTDLAFRSVRQFRDVRETLAVTSDAVQTLHRCDQVEVWPLAEPFETERIAVCDGPVQYHAPQSFNFQAEWRFVLDSITGEATLVGDDYDETTPLFDEDEPVDHVAVAFDATSREVIAWQAKGRKDTFELGYWAASDETRLTIQGFSPVLFHSYAIDSTVDAGTATLAVFYLKRGDSTVYCRQIADSFATEHRWAVGNFTPIWLSRIEVKAARMVIVAMDSQMRRMELRSTTYQLPLPPEVVTGTINPIAGTYAAESVRAILTDGPSGTLKDTVTGIYRAEIVRTTTDHQGPSGTLKELLSGEYKPETVRTTFIDSASAAIDETVTGVYRRDIVRSDPAETGAAGTIKQITGSYAAE